MAKGYLISRVVVNDPAAWAKYVEASAAAVQKFGAKPLVRGGRTQIMEGEGRARNVVMEFESYDQALAYYNSDEYQAARKHREGAGLIDMVIVEGA